MLRIINLQTKTDFLGYLTAEGKSIGGGVTGGGGGRFNIIEFLDSETVSSCLAYKKTENSRIKEEIT